MDFSAQDLMEKIIELRIQLDYQITQQNLSEVEDSIQYHAKELITTFESLKYNFPDEFKQFIEHNPKYKPLDVISLDNSEGLKQIISCITADKEQTVASIVKQVQTHSFHQWVKRNSKQEIADACETEADQAVYIHMSQFNLPQVKQEEIGDCIALAFTGKLSEEHEFFQRNDLYDEVKTGHLRKLMTINRRYINYDFKSLTIEDKTPQYKDRKTLYRPRGVAAKRMLDSSYTDGKHLFAVVSTSNSDTSRQGAQPFEVYKTLQTNFEKHKLDLEFQKDLTPSVIIFNNAFFCTENPDKIKHTVGTSTEEKTGYHHNNIRHKFDNLFEKPLGKSALDKINGLVTLSMLGNKEISWPRFPHTFDICDLIHCYPITAGADTLWLHTKFEQLKIYSNPQRTQKFFNFLLDYSNEVIDSLLKIKPNEDEPIIGDLKDSYERLLRGVTRNFNSYNLGRELNEEEVKKLNSLEEKIMEFNINHPNQTIDPTLSNSLIPYAFENQGKILTKTIEKRKEKFERLALKEKEEKGLFLEQIELAMGQNSEDSFDDKNLFKRLDSIAYQLYKGESSGKTLKLSDYLNVIQNNLQLANLYECDYFDVPADKGGNYNYHNNFLKASGSVRKNFIARLDSIAMINPELATAYENADTEICDFLRQFHSVEGRKTITENGGAIHFVEQLWKNLEEPLKAIRSITERSYENFQRETPFKHIEGNSMGGYWAVQIEKANKYQDFDGMVAMLHEYLHRIEDKFKADEQVSGKNFSELPKKIQTLKDMSQDNTKVQEAVNSIIGRYNYLGELFDEQNKSRKKYKPKHYRIS